MKTLKKIIAIFREVKYGNLRPRRKSHKKGTFEE